MRLQVVIRYIGMVILLNAGFMLLSAGISYAYGMDSGFYPLLLAGVLTSALGAFPLIFVAKSEYISTKESYVIVVGAWLVACLVGTFPYLLWGGEFDVSTAWFESVSGFSTTGATALSDIEALPHGLLFWRSVTQWLGGAGVVMFALIVLPAMGRTKMSLYSVELSPLARDNYKYRAQKIVRILISLYIGMTTVQAVLLAMAGMSWFDAVNHAFSTIATGGFSTRNLSIGYYNSTSIELITIVFMVLSGIHFGLLFSAVTSKFSTLFRSEVVRYYLLTILIAGAVIGLSLWNGGLYDNFGSAIRHSYFQASTIITTTGFVTADTNIWTSFAVAVLILLMFQCGCAGSTSGGIKTDRVLLSLKVLRARILQQQHPNAVIRVRLNGITQDNSVVNFAMFFIVIYLLIVIAGTIVVTAAGLDLMTGFSMVASCMGNVGPGFGEIGSMSEYSAISPFLKVFSTLFMLLGRLEIFGLLQLFIIKWWK